ncbi:MAG: carbon starvation protein A [Spirochaetaceae bacterium]|jgi:carbon starvation protein CstA|nr:carbon starvation protein A [Spirochaetaceae bacterium]
MISFIVGIVVLIIGYVIYGKFTENVLGIDTNAATPAVRINDGVDFVVIPTWRAVLIQFLNIAGTGPIFGAIAGALFGPAAFAWIVFGCVLGGAVHDYFSGMLSLRNNGSTIAEIVGIYLGTIPKYIMRVFSIVLLIFVGVVFVYTPAQVLNTLIDPNNKNIFKIALIAIICYYILATILPIDKIIGTIYPLFGAALLFMGLGITVMLFVTGEIRDIPEFAFQNMHLSGRTIFPYLFISIACGAVSGFHATQSPLMARCINNEAAGRKVFFGAMIIEGIVAMIWAAAAMGHFGGITGLAEAGNAPTVVTKVSTQLMGLAGGILAVLGVVACPITSGDTAFRSARLAIADALNFDQKPIQNRFIIALPLFAIGIALVFWSQTGPENFGIIWRYFSWSNQTLATIALWAASAYLAKMAKFYWIALIPAVFMTAVVTTYIIVAPEGLGLDRSYPLLGLRFGIALAAILFVLFMIFIATKQKGILLKEQR